MLATTSAKVAGTHPIHETFQPEYGWSPSLAFWDHYPIPVPVFEFSVLYCFRVLNAGKTIPTPTYFPSQGSQGFWTWNDQGA